MCLKSLPVPVDKISGAMVPVYVIPVVITFALLYLLSVMLLPKGKKEVC